MRAITITLEVMKESNPTYRVAKACVRSKNNILKLESLAQKV